MSPAFPYSDLEIGLHRWEPGRYTLEMRFTPPGSDTDERVVQAGDDALAFDTADLLAEDLDDAAYGDRLTTALFTAAEPRSLFDRARQAADRAGAPLRLRLFIGPNAPELHCLRWERLRDPGRDAPLLTGERVFFSRYLSSRNEEPAQSRPKADLRSLVVIANPTDLGTYGLAAVDVDGELARARQALGNTDVVELASGGAANLVTLSDALREGFDIFYLVCHGALVKGEPWLWLEKMAAPAEDPAGEKRGLRPVVTDRVSGSELVTRLAELVQRPRLVVLASCLSAGMAEGEMARSRDDGALAAIGPRLAQAGIPAVVAMQDNVTMETVAEFMPRFFRELMYDGQVDRAMSVARGAVRGRPDWWVPVLFMRLRDAQIWEPPPPRLDFEPETIYIPAGSFLMGADPGEGIPEAETPQHTVTLPAYRFGKYPVTSRQYAEFVRREKAQDVPKDVGWFLREPPADMADHPVTGVSWFDAVAYCNWLSKQSGRRYRLPTEAEWEKAASWAEGQRSTGAVATGLKRRYPWADEWDAERCNASGTGTTSVTAHPAGASPYGCQDMLGNAQEWTATLWGAQPGQPQQGYRDRPDGGLTIADPADLPVQARLVHRGGSYKSQPGELRCSARGSAAPGSRIPWRGFRVAMEI